jgi:hypothetical protein
MLSEVHLDKDLEQITGFGTAPRSLLPNFLHEATHHWCFLSPVGSTLAALQLRAQRHAIELLTKPEKERQKELQFQLCEALIRAETAEACLRPLAEGLALFTEFDAMTNLKSSVLSLPIEMATYFFGNLEFSQTELGPTPVIINMLRWMRLDEHAIDRKRGLFMMPLSYNGGGYLPGYLTVRSLWLRAAGRDARLLNETDLALMYLRSFFFDDMGLVARLLDPSTEELKSAEAILNHINQRFSLFLDVEPSDIESYEENVLAYEKDQSKLREINFSLHVEEQFYSLGDRLRTELLDEFKPNEAESVDDLLTLYAADIFGQRDIMYVGSLPVKVTVDQGCHFYALHKEAPILEGKAIDGVASGTGEGSLDLSFSILPKYKFRILTITRGNELVARRFLAPESITKNGAVRFNQFKGQHSIRQSLRDDSNQALERALKNSWMEISVTHVRKQLPSLVEKVYLPIALDSVPDKKLEASYAIMRKDGLYPVLNGDRDLIEGLALIGLCCSALSPDRGLVSAWFKRNGLELEATLDKLKQCNEKYGLPKVYDNGRQLLSTV